MVKHVCQYCGKVYIIPNENYGATETYCSRWCEVDAHEGNATQKAKRRKEIVFANNQMASISGRGVLDDRLRECKERGITYAELQKEKTLANQWKG